MATSFRPFGTRLKELGLEISRNPVACCSQLRRGDML